MRRKEGDLRNKRQGHVAGRLWERRVEQGWRVGKVRGWGSCKRVD